jgi:hypothetical protein
MQTKITFDKNYIQAKKQEWLENHIKNNKCYLPIITNQLKIECIGDLEKKFKDPSKDKERYTASLLSKLNLFPIAKYHHVDFVTQELLENIAIEQKHDFFNYVPEDYLSSRNLIRDLYSDSEKDKQDEQIEKWSKSSFSEEMKEGNIAVVGSSGKEIAQHYRNNARGNSGYIIDDLKYHISLNKEEPVSLEDIIKTVKSIRFNGSSTSEAKDFMKWIEDKNVITLPINMEKFLGIRMQNRSLCEFAPYTAYVYTITLLFIHNLLRNKTIPKKFNEQDSDWIDLNYIFYFPFIDCFASKDKFFNSFLKEFKQFEKITLLSE